MPHPAIEQKFVRRGQFLPFHRPFLGVEEEQEVVAAMRSGWLTTGPRTRRFEEEFAAFAGAAHAVALNSCTAALHLALVAGGLRPGDEAILPSITFPSAANAMIHEGIRPVFADIEPDTLNVDMDHVEALITERTRAVVPVHFAGHPVEQDRLQEMARRHGLMIIGDAAHATEAEFRGRHVSHREDATCYSFYATKNLTTGEGGMLTTDEGELAERVRLLALHGMSKDAWKRYTDEGYEHWDIIAPGYKYNMGDLAAALGLHQLARLPVLLEERRRQCEVYDRGFADLGELLRPLVRRPYVKSACHLYVVLVLVENLDCDRDTVLHEIQAENVGVGVHFRALHLHPWYRSRFGFAKGMLPRAEYASDRVISLPLYPGLAEEDQDYVIRVVRRVLTRHAR